MDNFQLFFLDSMTAEVADKKTIDLLQCVNYFISEAVLVVDKDDKRFESF